MRIKSLLLRNFRSYEETLIPFRPGVNFIFGENGRGKTNILEALYLLMTGRSFRTRHLDELIRFGQSSFYLELLFESNGIEQSLRMHHESGRRVLLHNKTPLSKLSALFEILKGTLLVPDDHLLIQGNPKVRRLYLDLQIAQTHPLYLHHLTRYQKAVKQRNTLLRRKQTKTLDVWEEQMTESAAYLQKKRDETVEELARFLHNQIELSYLPSPCDAAKLEKSRERDLILGTTSLGPHKDDLTILLKERSARSFASEGQKRHTVASLRFAQWKRLNSLLPEKPLLLVDDVSMSFDPKR
ncbi:MAG: DNA replication and repair protein RecF, partial [Chlamydiae bacterium]|nr:DNA replication and repair protein RecF [Chlamydiota bacterium]